MSDDAPSLTTRKQELATMSIEDRFRELLEVLNYRKKLAATHPDQELARVELERTIEDVECLLELPNVPTESLHPGIYLRNVTGTLIPLATEAGDGDTQLLLEALDDQSIDFSEVNDE